MTLISILQGSQHAIITDPSMLANMVALHPIVLQTEQTMAAPLREQVNFSKFNVTGKLVATGSCTNNTVLQYSILEQQ